MRRKVTTKRVAGSPGLRAFWAYARRDAAQSEPVQVQMVKRRLAHQAVRRPRRPA